MEHPSPFIASIAALSVGIALTGKWRIVEMPDHEADYPDMMESAYILFDGQGSGEFAFGCVPAIWGAEGSDAVELSWDDNDEMDEVNGDGWAELQPDGSLHGEISFHRGDGASFVAKPWATSSTAC